MVSKLAIGDRGMPWHCKEPDELAAWSEVNSKTEAFFDDRALRYYDPPQFHPGHEYVDLNVSIPQVKYNDTTPMTTTYLDSMLRAVMDVELSEGCPVDATIVTLSKNLTQLLALSQGYTNRQLLDKSLEFDVVGFDGQIFIYQAPKKTPEPLTSGSLTPLERLTYSGYSFGQILTLPKPPYMCTRDDFDDKFCLLPKIEEMDEYRLLVRTGINGMGVVLGTSADSIDGFKIPEDKLRNYVNFKTATQATHTGHERAFERKLLKTWIDGFISGIPRICVGFRDNNLRLVSMREYRTSVIPHFVQTSRVLAPEERWHPGDVLAFYAKLCEWLRDEVKDGKTYKLCYKSQTSHIVLKRAPVKIPGREIGFLSNEFVEWRYWLREHCARYAQVSSQMEAQL